MDPVRLGVLSGTEVGLVISSAMWGITTVQTVAYYLRFKSDSMYLKVAVRTNLTNDKLKLNFHRLLSTGTLRPFDGFLLLLVLKCER